jgi:3-dehydroquinate synthase
MDHPNISWEDNFENLFQSIQEEITQASAVYILMDENVSALWLNDMLEQCPVISSVHIIEIPAGEEAKEMDILQHIWRQWIEDKVDRNAFVINIGGGSTTDLGGLAASLFKRGIGFAHIPTTLTGMVDAAIGGKTAINFQGIKNIIGTFQEPDQLIICPHFLDTLEESEILSGFAEMIKHALIADNSLWEAYVDLEEINAKSVVPFIKRNIQIKNRIVFEDPFEEGIRKQLNFGHTLGHALESFWLEKQSPKSHGHCVALGMCFACFVSNHYKLLDSDEMNETIDFTLSLYKIERKDWPNWLHIQPYLTQDKKNNRNTLQLVLLETIGKSSINHSLSLEDAEWLYGNFIEFIHSQPSE